MDMVDPLLYPALARVIDAVLDNFPGHRQFLEISFRDRGTELLNHSETVASVIAALSTGPDHGMDKLASDYKFLCEEIVLPEEIHFRRTGAYRLTTFHEAYQSVYGDPEFMRRYMNGLLVSDVTWLNHCQALHHYSSVFLPSLPERASLLEIGPGHGLLLYLATLSDKVGSLSAWDVSDTSLASSRAALEKMRARQPVHFERRDLLAPDLVPENPRQQFDAIVFSEVLEHLEQPAVALNALRRLCKPGGCVWINVPANSPAPDHLYLVRNPADVETLARDVGFEIVATQNFPMTGYTLERALRRKFTITCILVCRRPA